MAILKQASSPPPHPTQLLMTPGVANGTKKSSGGGGGKDVKQRANYYMNKLSDRDTEGMAVAELEAMARVLPAESLPSFLSAISDTRPSDKTPLRRHCLRLLSLLSRTQPPQSLSPFLPRMVSSVLRRLRDPDSSVRSACVDAVRDMSSCCCSSSFFSVFLKPLSESLLLEQDHNAQMGSAMCLAAAIDEVSAAADGESGTLDHDLAQHLHRLLPRLVKLTRSECFKAKPALLSLLGSIVAAGGASTPALLEILVPCLSDSLSSDDWATRKAASEALTRVAAIRDTHSLSGFKSSYFSSFQARRFDKVKIVRDSMNQMLEAWKDIPGSLKDEDDHGSNTSPSQSRSSSASARQESEGDARLVVGPRNSSSARSSSSLHTLRKDRSPVSKSPTDSSLTPAARRTTPPRNEKRTSPPLSHYLDRRKPHDWKIEIAIPYTPPFTVMCEDEQQNGQARDEVWEHGKNQEGTTCKLEVKRLLFEKNPEQRVNKFGCLKSGSRVVPFQEKGNSEQSVEIDQLFEDNKDSDLSLIRKQLLQIENQQSSLFDLVQRFIGNSQNGIRSLETRVHGLEMALDEISHDLAMSSGRMSGADPTVHCCKIPGAEFLSSKFWRRNEGRYSSRFSISGTSPLAGVQNSVDKGTVNSRKWEKQGFGHNSGFVINPLAEVNSQTRGSSYVSSDRMPKSVMHESGSRQAEDSNMIDEISTFTCTADMISRSS